VNGVHGDNCHTFYAGTPAPAARALVECTHDCMMKAIAGGNQPAVLVSRALASALLRALSLCNLVR
jgi:methionine aminopeptidase